VELLRCFRKQIQLPTAGTFKVRPGRRGAQNLFWTAAAKAVQMISGIYQSFKISTKIVFVGYGPGDDIRRLSPP
jgi:hypothetical protein